jgi:hypothetical protein
VGMISALNILGTPLHKYHIKIKKLF